MNTTIAGQGLLLAMLGLLAVTGCSKQEAPSAVQPAPQARPPAAVPAPVAPPVAEAPPAPADSAAPPAARPASGAASGPASGHSIQQPVLRAVRTGRQPVADRVVFEFEGKLPAWQVEYVERPVRDCGSGDAVPVAGDAWLQVRFTGAQAHTGTGAPTGGARRRALAQPVARELVRTCDFEGEVTWVIGVARPNAYTAKTMAAPHRLVIDIAH